MPVQQDVELTERERDTETETERKETSSSSPSPTSVPASAASTSNGAGVLDAAAKQNVKLAYLDYNQHLKSLWHDLPGLLITYKNLSFTVPTPVKPQHIQTLGTALFDKFRPVETKPFHALQNVSGVIKPGTMTLILAPPGHGKSTLLKALGDKLGHSKYKSGDIFYNGQTSSEALAHGIYVSKMVNYVEQQDVHMPLLTVRETFQFALDNAVPDPSLLNDPKIIELHQHKVDAVIELLGLKECENTIVGNAMNRGISGGQKKRVTLGEFIVGNARALFLDEISTGLDAAATFDITSALRRWSRLMNGSAVVALLQPAPEVYEMFDDVILMREGCVMYHGPRTDLPTYLDREFGIQIPVDQDEADFLTEFLTDPLKIARRQLAKQQRHAAKTAAIAATQPQSVASSVPATVTTQDVQAEGEGEGEGERETSEIRWHTKRLASVTDTLESAPLPKTPDASSSDYKKDEPRTEKEYNTPIRDLSLMHTRAMAEVWEKSTTAFRTRAVSSESQPLIDVNALSKYSKAQYASPFPRSLWYHTILNLTRQRTLISRDKGYVGPRIGQAIFMGLVLGSLFYSLGICDFYNRIGLILFAAIFGGFSNMPELPIAVEARQVVSKQTGAGFYSTFSYVFSVVLMHVPLAATEAGVFSIILYFMTSFTVDAGRFFFFYLGIFASNMSLSVFYRMIAYTTPNPDVANQMAGPTTAIFLLFGGFLITYDKIPNFMQWLYWLSPFSWIVKSLAQNEFFDDRYTLDVNSVECANVPSTYTQPKVEVGSVFLRSFQISTDGAYKWAGIGYLFGFFAFFVVMSALVLKYKVVEVVTGTRRSEDEDDAIIAQQAAERVKQGNVINKDGTITINAAPIDGTAKESSAFLDSSAIMVATGAASALPFTPITLAFKHLHYTVKVTKDGKKNVDRKLIEDVSGYAKPGTLTALMGSSGAGKTTLMDVIAGRKTAGKIEGEILVNGYPKHEATFSRVTGYVEQTDVHTPTDTVREALMFSARLRLPSSVTHEQRVAFVDEVLHILELDTIADRVIGDEITPGLSAGQLKRVTIGVELVANPSVLFLDEPTSGLDSRAALVVMRVIKRIASTGRSVVCTIHQPSSELFYMFDRLLLLKSGGKEVFFGDVGEQGSELVHYFETIEGVDSPKKPLKANPASWILDVIGAGVVKSNRQVDHAALYAASALKATNTEEIERACQPNEASKKLHFESRYASSFLYQWAAVQYRFYQFHWRNVAFNLTRLSLLGFLGVLFGLVYLDLSDDDYPGVSSKIAVIYMTAAFNGVLHSATALPVLIRQRAVFYREKASYTYAPFAYSTSLAFVEIPYVAFASFLFVIPYYFMVGFPAEARLFFEYYLFHFLLSLNFCYAGQMLAGLFPNMMVANIMQGLMFTFLFLFGGVFIRPTDIPKGWIWMYYINPVPKALIGICASQFECIRHADNTTSGYGCGMITDPVTGLKTPIDTFVQNELDFGYDVKWAMAGWLVLTLFVFRCLVALIVSKVSHITR